jgi:fluoroquinolone resistance protein
MKQQVCAKPNCQKVAISFSKFCGEHTKNKDLVAKLKTVATKNVRKLHLDEVEIKKITLSNKTFHSPNIQNCDFDQVNFDSCTFLFFTNGNSTFTECKFINCYFEQWDCTDITFHETIFENCTLRDCNINQSSFADETVFVNCEWDGCSCIGGMFSETGTNKNIKFHNTQFIQASFNQAIFSESQFVETIFSKTALYDSNFNDCYFTTVTHDFPITGVPMLCDFRGCKIENMTVSKLMRTWNNFNKQPQDFYLSLVSMLTTVNHPNYLSELAKALTHLDKLGYLPDWQVLDSIKNLFKRLVMDAYEMQDYRTMGDIMSEFGNIPLRFRSNIGFMLPPPSDAQTERDNISKLTITANAPEWTLAKVSQFLQLLATLEPNLPSSIPQTVNYIERGSLIIQLLGGFKQLLVLLHCIADFGKTSIQAKLKTKELESEILAIEKERKRIELEYLNKNKALEYQKDQLAYVEKMLQVLEILEKRTGFDYRTYLRTTKGKNAKNIATIINEAFPMLNLVIEE